MPYPIRMKDPNSEEPFAVNWERALQPSGDSILSAAWTLPAGLTLIKSEIIGYRAIVWVRGGTSGKSYLITCRMTSVQGRIRDKSIQLNVREM